MDEHTLRVILTYFCRVLRDDYPPVRESRGSQVVSIYLPLLPLSSVERGPTAGHNLTETTLAWRQGRLVR